MAKTSTDTADNNMFRAIKYRIYPTEEQEIQITQTFGCCRFVYNAGLELQNGLYWANQGRMSRIDLNNYCNRTLKEVFPFLRETDKFSLTNSLYALEDAFKNFFEGRAHYPNFKGKKDPCQSYTTNVVGNNICIFSSKTKKHAHGFVKLPKLGKVAAVIHRLPNDDWNLKKATISKTATGKYFVSVVFEIPNNQVKPVIPTVEKTIGLDYSSPDFYVDSNGQQADVPHYYREAEKRLAIEQRKLSHMQEGSNNYEKQKQKVATIHEHTANCRKDFTHKLSRKIANSYDVVCVEDLDLQALAETLNFGKATNDNGFGMFRDMLKYKFEEQGKHFVKIDKWFPSSKTCHECGCYNPGVVLGVMTWTCPHCGKQINRDYNAALNIRDEGLRMLQEMPQTA